MKEALPLTENQEKILKLAIEEGGITAEDAEEVYSNLHSAYRALNRLADTELIEKKEAPPTSAKQFVYVPSDIAVKLISP